MSLSGSITDISEPKELFSSKKKIQHRKIEENVSFPSFFQVSYCD
jgi:hypothetical protein